MSGTNDTSDIGMMYRQYLQSRNMPANYTNMQRVIEQSQREPGMIAGLSVQAPDPTAGATAPPNIAGASSNSSGALPPPPPPTPIPRMPMPTTMGGGTNVPPPQVVQQAAQTALPLVQHAAATGQVPPEVAAMIPSAGGGGDSPGNTPPPGQPPGPAQVSAPEAGSDSMLMSTLASLGIGSVGIKAILNRINGGGVGDRSMSVPAPAASPAPAPVVTEITPNRVAAAVNRSEPVPGPQRDILKLTPANGASTSSPGSEPAPNTPAAPAKSEPSVAKTIEKAVGPDNTPAFMRRPGNIEQPNLTGSTAPLPKPPPTPAPAQSQRKTTMEEIYPPSLYPRGSAAFQSPSGGAPLQGPPVAVKTPAPPPIPASLSRQTNAPNYVQGVNPIGIPQRPEVSGPPVAPHDPATAPIGNIVAEKAAAERQLQLNGPEKQLRLPAPQGEPQKPTIHLRDETPNGSVIPLGASGERFNERGVAKSPETLRMEQQLINRISRVRAPGIRGFRAP